MPKEAGRGTLFWSCCAKSRVCASNQEPSPGVGGRLRADRHGCRASSQSQVSSEPLKSPPVVLEIAPNDSAPFGEASEENVPGMCLSTGCGQRAPRVRAHNRRTRGHKPAVWVPTESHSPCFLLTTGALFTKGLHAKAASSSRGEHLASLSGPPRPACLLYV